MLINDALLYIREYNKMATENIRIGGIWKVKNGSLVYMPLDEQDKIQLKEEMRTAQKETMDAFLSARFRQ